MVTQLFPHPRLSGVILFCCSVFLGFAGTVVPVQAASGPDAATALDAALSGAHRSVAHQARDRFRHPKETLLFFGLQPDMRVLEILPGRGWYTEILAPVLREQGRLTVASFGADHENDYLRNLHIDFVRHLSARPDLYDRVRQGLFRDRQALLPDVADATQDMVLTFRNTHNWIRFGGIETVYQGIHRVLRPGGILGIVQHRAAPGSDVAEAAQQGYVPEQWLVHLLERLGFRLSGRADINANPKDSRDYPEGVWTLPPTFRLQEQDRGKYAAIGESDRMTLKFTKIP